MKIHIKNWASAIILQKERIAIPIMTHSGIEMIGKRVLDAVTSGKIHYEAIRVLSEKYPSSATTAIMDLTVEAEAFGATVHFSLNEVPTVTGRLVSDMKSIEALEVPSLLAARIPEYLLANRLMSEQSTKPVFGGCIGPYSLAGRLFDMSEIMMALYIEPESIRLLLEKCTSFIINYVKAQKAEGVHGIIIAEPAAGLLSNELCKEFSSVYIQRLVEEVQDDYFMVILHNCGNKGHCTEAMVSTGAAGFHFGNQIDMIEALKECPADTLVLGNLDPVSVFKMSDSEKVYSTTRKLLNNTHAYSNFILSSGCDTPPEIPFENIDSFYAALRDYNREKQ